MRSGFKVWDSPGAPMGTRKQKMPAEDTSFSEPAAGGGLREQPACHSYRLPSMLSFHPSDQSSLMASVARRRNTGREDMHHTAAGPTPAARLRRSSEARPTDSVGTGEDKLTLFADYNKPEKRLISPAPKVVRFWLLPPGEAVVCPCVAWAAFPAGPSRPGGMMRRGRATAAPPRAVLARGLRSRKPTAATTAAAWHCTHQREPSWESLVLEPLPLTVLLLLTLVAMLPTDKSWLYSTPHNPILFALG